MKSNIEILNTELLKNGSAIPTIDVCISAMDEARRDAAIGFHRFAYNRFCRYNGIHLSGWMEIGNSENIYTDEQLYSLYLNSINKAP